MFNKIKFTKLALALAGSSLFLGGCTSMVPAAKQTDQRIDVGAQKATETYNNMFDKIPPAKKNFKESNDIYIDPNPLPSYVVNKKPLPDIFRNNLKVTMPSAVPVNEVIAEIQRSFAERYKNQLNIDVSQDVYNPAGGLGQLIANSGGSGAGAGGGAAAGQGASGGAQGQTINNLNPNQINNVLIDSFVFDGSLESALNLISQKAGLSWEWNGGGLEIYRFKVKNYYLSTLAGASNATGSTGAGGSSSSGSNSSTGGSGAGASGANNSVDQLPEITTYIRSMLSPAGRVSIMPSTGIITVRDTPFVHETLERSIKELNAVLSKQIHINIEVYEVEVANNENLGVDWNLVWQKAANQFAFGYQSVTKTTGLNTSTIGVTNGNFTGTALKFGFDSVRARLANSTSGSFVTQNGKITPILFKESSDYIDSINCSTTTGTASTTSCTTSKAAGDTGIQGRSQARIQPDGKILVKLDLSIQELKNLRPYSYTSAGGQSTIQLADKSEKQFSQEFALQSGQTLILSGFKKMQSKMDQNGMIVPDNLLMGGSRTSGTKDTYVVLIATPYLIEYK